MRIVVVGRLVAAVLSLSTFVFLFLHDSWRTDDPFLVPDLILCAILAAAALLPDRLAAAALPTAFAYTTGVLVTSVFSYASRGELGLPSLVGALTATLLAIRLQTPATGPESAGNPDPQPTPASP